MKKNILVAQSGGPTSAINATLAGVIQTSLISSQIDVVYGSLNGVEGILQENFIDLTEIFQSTMDIEELAHTPSAALGSCRLKLKDYKEDDSQYKKIIEVFRKKEIGIFIYIGGNDSMDTVDKLSRYCEEQGIADEFCIIGAPKTIDNDLVMTDHCPGFGSAAKYIATTFSELDRDISVYQNGGVLLVEVMGRNAGWLTAASALSRMNGGNGPDLIYLCEVPFNMDKFIEDTKEILSKRGRVIVALSEGIQDGEGRYISELYAQKEKDAFGHTYIAGAGKVLEDEVRNKIGCKVRSVELNLMQRCAAHILSGTDIQESRMLGAKAVQCGLEERSGRMARIERISSKPYKIRFSSVSVSKVANREKKIPLEWIADNGHDVKTELIDYLLPLIRAEEPPRYHNGIPEYYLV